MRDRSARRRCSRFLESSDQEPDRSAQGVREYGSVDSGRLVGHEEERNIKEIVGQFCEEDNTCKVNLIELDLKEEEYKELNLHVGDGQAAGGAL